MICDIYDMIYVHCISAYIYDSGAGDDGPGGQGRDQLS